VDGLARGAVSDARGPFWDAIVLAGGKGERLGGVSKPDLVLGGKPLLDRTLAAVAEASTVVVVGGPRRAGVRWSVEEPQGGGPAAAIVAGLRELAAAGSQSPWTLVLAVDTPGAADAVPRLLGAIELDGTTARDGAQLVDAAGRAQPLIAIYRTTALVAAAEGAHDTATGMSVRTLVGGLKLVAVSDRDDAAHDLDTWDDVNFWKERLG